MRYVRTIMAQLARLLLRIARRLDGNAVAPQGTVSRAYIEDLRRHYPGAPLHWIEAFARRGIALDGPAPALHSAVEAVASDPLQPAQRPAAPSFEFGRPGRKIGPAKWPTTVAPGRRELRLRSSAPSLRPVLTLPASAASVTCGEPGTVTRPERQRKPRASLSFAAPNPVPVSPTSNAETGIRPDRADPFQAPQQHERLFARVSFPVAPDRETRPLPRFRDAATPPSLRQAAPELPMSSRSSLEQDFRELLSKWPTLPRVEEGSSPMLAKGSPVEICAEQVVGTWSV